MNNQPYLGYSESGPSFLQDLNNEESEAYSGSTVAPPPQHAAPQQTGPPQHGAPQPQAPPQVLPQHTAPTPQQQSTNQSQPHQQSSVDYPIYPGAYSTSYQGVPQHMHSYYNSVGGYPPQYALNKGAPSDPSAYPHAMPNTSTWPAHYGPQLSSYPPPQQPSNAQPPGQESGWNASYPSNSYPQHPPSQYPASSGLPGTHAVSQPSNQYPMHMPPQRSQPYQQSPYVTHSGYTNTGTPPTQPTSALTQPVSRPYPSTQDAPYPHSKLSSAYASSHSPSLMPKSFSHTHPFPGQPLPTENDPLYNQIRHYEDKLRILYTTRGQSPNVQQEILDTHEQIRTLKATWEKEKLMKQRGRSIDPNIPMQQRPPSSTSQYPASDSPSTQIGHQFMPGTAPIPDSSAFGSVSSGEPPKDAPEHSRKSDEPNTQQECLQPNLVDPLSSGQPQVQQATNPQDGPLSQSLGVNVPIHSPLPSSASPNRFPASASPGAARVPVSSSPVPQHCIPGQPPARYPQQLPGTMMSQHAPYHYAMHGQGYYPTSHPGYSPAYVMGPRGTARMPGHPMQGQSTPNMYPGQGQMMMSQSRHYQAIAPAPHSAYSTGSMPPRHGYPPIHPKEGEGGPMPAYMMPPSSSAPHYSQPHLMPHPRPSPSHTDPQRTSTPIKHPSGDNAPEGTTPTEEKPKRKRTYKRKKKPDSSTEGAGDTTSPNKTLDDTNPAAVSTEDGTVTTEEPPKKKRAAPRKRPSKKKPVEDPEIAEPTKDSVSEICDVSITEVVESAPESATPVPSTPVECAGAADIPETSNQPPPTTKKKVLKSRGKPKKKKPLPTLIKKKQKSRRGHDSDSDQDGFGESKGNAPKPPTAPIEEPLTAKRRSGRVTTKKKYSNIDLGLFSDEEAELEKGEDQNIATIQDNKEDQNEMPVRLVDKVLGQRVSKRTVVHTEESATGETAKEREEEEEVEEYYLKYKGFSYLHCEWKCLDEIEDPRIQPKIKRYQTKRSRENHMDEEEEELFNADYVEVDRVLDMKIFRNDVEITLEQKLREEKEKPARKFTTGKRLDDLLDQINLGKSKAKEGDTGTFLESSEEAKEGETGTSGESAEKDKSKAKEDDTGACVESTEEDKSKAKEDDTGACVESTEEVDSKTKENNSETSVTSTEEVISISDTVKQSSPLSMENPEIPTPVTEDKQPEVLSSMEIDADKESGVTNVVEVTLSVSGSSPKSPESSTTSSQVQVQEKPVVSPKPQTLEEVVQEVVETLCNDVVRQLDGSPEPSSISDRRGSNESSKADEGERSTPVDVTYYLVKWRSLSYEDATWELAQDVDPAKVKEFLRWRTIPKDLNRQLQRPKPDQWRKIDEQRVYKNNNHLRDYQLEGVNWLTFCYFNHRNCILADEMGLGKTVQSITFLLEVFNYGIKGPFLVIVPLSTVGNWQREFENWADMNVIVYHGSSTSRSMLQEYEMFYRNSKGQRMKEVPKFHALITTFEILMTDIEEMGEIDWRIVVIDEAHRLKNKNCKLGEGLRYLELEHRVLLSGTPLQNNVEELFSLLHFLEPKKFDSPEAFLAEFGDLKTEEQVDGLKAILKPMMLRRLKEDVEKSLAPKEETIIEVELTNIQKKYYRAIMERNFAFLCKGTTGTNMPNLMNTMMELRKCCNHPFLIKGAEDNIVLDMRNQSGHDWSHVEDLTPQLHDNLQFHALVNASGKLVLVHKLLPKLKLGGHKVLIFSQMVRVLDILEDYLISQRYQYERIDGRIHGLLRQEAIDRFTVDSNKFVFLLCTKAGGLGINLTAADVVIIYDSDWNPQNDLQAQARCHRIGQLKMVNVYRLITRNTYEREMFDRASLKLGLDKAVLQSIGTKETNLAQMSKKEIEDLLKKGAYGALMEDDKAGEDFCEEDIDKILQSRSTVVQLDQGEKNSSFSKATFSMTDNRSDIELDDPLFWQKWAKKVGVEEEVTNPDSLIMEQPRRRKQTSRYTAETAMGTSDFGESSRSSDDDDDGLLGGSKRNKKGQLLRKSKKSRRDTLFDPPNTSRLQAALADDSRSGEPLDRSDLFKVEKCLLLWGWGRWREAVSRLAFKRPVSPDELEGVARALLIYAMRHYTGDERIRNFVCDLIRPNSSLTSMRAHTGLAAPVARGRRGRRGRQRPGEVEEVELPPSDREVGGKLPDEELLYGDLDPDTVLTCSGFKRHVERVANKLLHRIQTLYLLHHEVIGPLRAACILSGKDHLSVEPPLTPLLLVPQLQARGDLPAFWWDARADSCFLFGVFKHGFEKYAAIRADPKLCFLDMCGPPPGASHLWDGGDDFDLDAVDEEKKSGEPKMEEDTDSKLKMEIDIKGEKTELTEDDKKTELTEDDTKPETIANLESKDKPEEECEPKSIPEKLNVDDVEEKCNSKLESVEINGEDENANGTDKKSNDKSLNNGELNPGLLENGVLMNGEPNCKDDVKVEEHVEMKENGILKCEADHALMNGKESPKSPLVNGHYEVKVSVEVSKSVLKDASVSNEVVKDTSNSNDVVQESPVSNNVVKDISDVVVKPEEVCGDTSLAKEVGDDTSLTKEVGDDTSLTKEVCGDTLLAKEVCDDTSLAKEVVNAEVKDTLNSIVTKVVESCNNKGVSEVEGEKGKAESVEKTESCEKKSESMSEVAKLLGSDDDGNKQLESKSESNVVQKMECDTKPDLGDVEEKEYLPFPSITDLNGRFRKLIAFFQRLKHRGELDAIRNPQMVSFPDQAPSTPFNLESSIMEPGWTDVKQLKWSRRESADFYRVVSSFGVEYNRKAALYNWDRFRALANLTRKSDQAVTEYFRAFYAMCRDVCKKEQLDDGLPPPLVAVDTISEERAGRCLSKIDLLNKIRQDILSHPELDARIELCQKSSDFPDWWIPGKHDKELLKGVAKHGLSRTDINIVMDRDLCFRDVVSSIQQRIREDPTLPPGQTCPSADAVSSLVDAISASSADLLKQADPGKDATPTSTVTDKKESEKDSEVVANEKKEAEAPKDSESSLKKIGVDEDKKTEEVTKENESGAGKPLIDKSGVEAKVVKDKDDDVAAGEDGKSGDEVKPVKSGEEEQKVVEDPDQELSQMSGPAASTRGQAITAPAEQTEWSLKFATNIAVGWPKDRTIQHRLESVCQCVELGHWPTPRRFLIPPGLSLSDAPSSLWPPTISDPPTPVPYDSYPHMDPAMLQTMRAVASGSLHSSTSGRRTPSRVGRPRGRGRGRPSTQGMGMSPDMQLFRKMTGQSDDTDSMASLDVELGPLTPAVSSSIHLPPSTPHTPSRSELGSPLPTAPPLASTPNPQVGGKKRKIDSLADRLLSAAVVNKSQKLDTDDSPHKRSQQEPAATSEDPWQVRVPLISLQNGSLVYGEEAPLRRNLEKWLEEHPDYMPYSVEKADQEIYTRVANQRGQDTSPMETLAYRHYMSMLQASNQSYSMIPTSSYSAPVTSTPSFKAAKKPENDRITNSKDRDHKSSFPTASSSSSQGVGTPSRPRKEGPSRGRGRPSLASINGTSPRTSTSSSSIMPPTSSSALDPASYLTGASANMDAMMAAYQSAYMYNPLLYSQLIQAQSNYLAAVGGSQLFNGDAMASMAQQQSASKKTPTPAPTPAPTTSRQQHSRCAKTASALAVAAAGSGGTSSTSRKTFKTSGDLHSMPVFKHHKPPSTAETDQDDDRDEMVLDLSKKN